MNLNRSVMLSIFTMLVMFMSACGGNNSDEASSVPGGNPAPAPDTNTTLPVVDNNSSKLTLVLPVSATVLKTNSQVVNIEVKLFDASNNPYSIGTITKVNPNDVLTGRDIGSFDKDTSSLVNGVANFVYTAPDNLDANTSNLSFAFYHDSNTSDTRTYTMSIVPEVNQTVLTSYKLIPSNVNDTTMDLESSKNISYSVTRTDNTSVPDNNITSIKVSSLNPSLAILEDTYGNSGVELNSTNENGFSVSVVSNKKSGLVPIKVEAVFFDENNNEQNITELYEIVILSGAPTAMSLSYASTEQDASKAKFIENWVLTVTDKYNNVVNTTPSVSMGAIVGYAQSSDATTNAGNYLFYDVSQGFGTLVNSSPLDTFTSTNSPFNNVDPINETLVLFGASGYKFDAFGKWDINTNTANVLTLDDDYNGTNITGFTYAVGSNFRNETCDSSPVVANVYAANNSNTLDESGSMIIKVEYDYYLVGKSIVLWTNLLGASNSSDKKIGLGKKVTLRGQGLKADTYNYAAGYSGIERLYISIENTVESYKNANFSYSVEVSGEDTNWSIASDSMSAGITDCTNGGIGYVDVNISTSSNAGEIKLVNLLPRSEF